MMPPIVSMKPGDIRRGRVRTMTLARVLALSGGPLEKKNWPDKNLHTDAEAASSAGLSEVVVSGTQWEGHMASLLVDTMGDIWFHGGRMNVKIPRSVKIGDSLCPYLKLDAIADSDGRAVADFTIWCENAAGEQVLAGTARCEMPERGGASS